MSTLERLKTLLVDIVGKYRTEYEIIADINSSINELKELINSYAEEKSKASTSIKDLAIQLASMLGYYDKNNFSFKEEDFSIFVDEYRNPCFNGFPSMFFIEDGELYGAEIVEIGYRNGELYIRTDYDEEITNIPSEYKDTLTQFFSNAIDTIKYGNYCLPPL